MWVGRASAWSLPRSVTRGILDVIVLACSAGAARRPWRGCYGGAVARVLRGAVARTASAGAAQRRMAEALVQQPVANGEGSASSRDARRAWSAVTERAFAPWRARPRASCRKWDCELHSTRAPSALPSFRRRRKSARDSRARLVGDSEEPRTRAPIANRGCARGAAGSRRGLRSCGWAHGQGGYRTAAVEHDRFTGMASTAGMSNGRCGQC